MKPTETSIAQSRNAQADEEAPDASDASWSADSDTKMSITSQQIKAGEAADEKRKSKRIRRQMDDIKLPTTWWYRFGVWMERKLSRLSVRNNFWQRVTSWFYLPLAYRSGIRLHKGSVGTFSAILPFSRFNRNWYNAMAGGALLANSEVAGGMYIFKKCSGDWTVVCKELNYRFMRPCAGPAVYNIDAREDLDALIEQGEEFNITLDMEVAQMVTSRLERERRVGICTATFHVTPKTQYRKRKHWQKIQKRQKELEAKRGGKRG